jgi:glycosyltransferase involved in cell wall biosynthesis
MNSVLIISMDKIDRNMAGSGIRNWEIAHQLAKHCQVTLAIPYPTDLTSEEISLVHIDYENEDLSQLAKDADVIILGGTVLHHHPYLRDLRIPIVVDVYAPWLLENLIWHDQDDWENWFPAYEKMFEVQMELLKTGDYFICASERQRDYWLGMLHAARRINPLTFRHDHSLRNLIEVVPYGLPEEDPRSTRPVLKGVHPAISKEDKVILWSGGMWEWLDPLTVIRAVGCLISRHPELKLYFMGTRHPNPAVVGMQMPAMAVALSQELDLYDRHVFFGDWVPYRERANYLMEADLSVISHPEHIETRFSFRTRMLDCIWAGIPLVITQGDGMSDWVENYGLGYCVPPQNVEAMASAIERILVSGGREAYTQGFEDLRAKLRWSIVAEPLIKFCVQPGFAADIDYMRTAEQEIQEKDLQFQRLQDTLHRYQSSLPLRLYYSIKHMLGKM